MNRMLVIALLLILGTEITFSSRVLAAPFIFFAIGDLPYGDPSEAYPVYENLIRTVNRMEPSFTIHVGDTKSGYSRCSDEQRQDQLRFFLLFESALIYVPGDNEWTDCHRLIAGQFDPIERLSKLRETFFRSELSLGQAPLTLERQTDVMPDEFSLYVENSRFEKEGVLFIQVHIVGSNNNFEPRDLAAINEFLARDAANIAWIKSSMRMAVETNARAVILSIHADVFRSGTYWTDFPEHSGFRRSIGETFLPLAKSFQRPVLVIHGDSHVFKFDYPFKDDSGNTIENISRLEVPGGFGNIGAVRIDVHPNSSDKPVFSPQPIHLTQ